MEVRKGAAILSDYPSTQKRLVDEHFVYVR
jgi:hypothetical protein